MLRQLLVLNDARVAACEVFQNIKLLNGEGDFPSVERHPACGRVQRQPPDENSRICPAPEPADYRLDTGIQLRKVKWLCDIVVAAKPQATDPLLQLAAGGYNQYGR